MLQCMSRSDAEIYQPPRCKLTETNCMLKDEDFNYSGLYSGEILPKKKKPSKIETELMVFRL